MTYAEILRMKLNLADCALHDKGKEDFLAKIDNFHVLEIKQAHVYLLRYI